MSTDLIWFLYSLTIPSCYAWHLLIIELIEVYDITLPGPHNSPMPSTGYRLYMEQDLSGLSRVALYVQFFK